MNVLGFDIGGTKCAVVSAKYESGDITLLDKKVIPTDLSVSPYEMIERMVKLAEEMNFTPDLVGISCGGPLDSEKGVILSPPNLSGWDNVEAVKTLNEHFGVPVRLQNDANAGAVAEWMFGSGKGTKNFIFMTFGTGLGAGLILNSKLYEGSSGNAGEAGHIRISENGPVGYNKAGSFEGFCSGAGIAKLAKIKAEDKLKEGITPLYLESGEISAKTVAEAARKGDETALEVFRISGEKLGLGLSVLIDLLNPDKIALGGVFGRCKDLLWPHAERVLKEETLAPSRECCKVTEAKLSENIGDYAAVAAAII